METINFKNKNKQNCWKLIGEEKETQKKQTFPLERSKHLSVIYNSFIYIFGGSQLDEPLNDFWKFDLNNNKWFEIPKNGNFPGGRYFSSGLLFNDKFYIFGGFSQKNHNDLYAFDFKNETWEYIECNGELPCERSGHAIHLWNNFFWVFGGFNGRNRLNDMYSLNLTTKEWKQIKATGDIPHPRMNFSSTVYKNYLFLFSGHAGLHSTNDLFQFNFETFEWNKIEDTIGIPERRFGNSMVAFQDKLFIFGGNKKDTLSNSLYSYNIEQKTWNHEKTIGQKPKKVCFHSCSLHDETNSMFIFGGSIYDNKEKIKFSNQLYQFKFAFIFPHSTLCQDLKKLLENKFLYDTTIITKGKEGDPVIFYGHKAILAARCAYFSLFFMSNLAKVKESEIIKIDINVSPNVLSKIINYIYTDEFDSHNLTIEEFFELKLLSDEYQLTRLSLLCENYLVTNLNNDNIILILQAAVKNDWKNIENWCISYIIKHYSEIVLLSSFETLNPQLLVRIMRAQQQKEKLKKKKKLLDNNNQNNKDNNITDIVPELIQIPKSNLIDDLESLYKDGDYSDFNLIVNEEKIPCHLCILIARCNVFNAASKSGMKELELKEMKVSIGDVTIDAFKSFLNYLYTDNIEMPVEHAVYCLRLSDFYQLTNNHLLTHCIRNIEQNTNPSNLLLSLEAAYNCKLEKLIELFLDEISIHFVEISSSSYLELLPKELLIEIIRKIAKEKT